MLIVKSIVITLVVIFIVLKVLLKKIDLVDAFVFLIPFKSIRFDIGLSIYGFQVAAFLLITYKIFFTKNKRKTLIEPWILLYMFYFTISTIIISNFFIDHFIKNEYDSGYFRGEGRYISVLFKTIVLDYGLIFLIHNQVKNVEKIYRLVRLYLQSLTILCIFGIIQVLISIILGVDIFPNTFDEFGEVRKDFVENFNSALPFVRLTSIGAEPKNIASSLSIGITLIAFLNRQNIKILPLQPHLVWLFIICIIMSLSTSGFGLLAILLIVLIISGIYYKSFWKFRIKYIYFISFVALLLYYFWNFIIDVIDKRIIERANELVIEEVDEVIVEFLISNPNWAIFGSGNGNIHNLVTPFLGQQWYAGYLQGNIFSSRYGYLKLVSENGVIGFFIFSISFLLITFKLSKFNNGIGKVLCLSIFTLLLFFYVRSHYVLSELIFISGLGLSYLTITKKV